MTNDLNDLNNLNNHTINKQNQWITYVIRGKKNGEYITISEPYDPNAPEHDVVPNHKSFLALFKGDSLNETVARANEFINQQQEAYISGITFEQIKKINQLAPKDSYVELPNGQGYRIKTIDELKREGLWKD